MDLQKEKSLPVGLATWVAENPKTPDEAHFTAPAYIININGVKCAISMGIYAEPRPLAQWAVYDCQYGEELAGPYPTFEHLVEALMDLDNKILEEHRRLAEAGTAEVKQWDDYYFRVDNPLKGVPGIALLPARTTDEMLYDYDAEYDSDYEEDDEWEATVRDIIEGDDESDEERVDWDDLFSEKSASSDAEIPEDDNDLDDERGPMSDFIGEKISTFALSPFAAYIARVGPHQVAFRVTQATGPMAAWEAFDVSIGESLWQSVSLAEAMRAAPLMLPVVVTEDEEASLDTMLYTHALNAAFQGKERDVQQYLDRGYLRMNGPQYLQLMERLYVDIAQKESFDSWCERVPEIRDLLNPTE